MISSKIETTLIQIIPEYINLKNYYPERINEQTITIRNNCNIPLILFLSSSDSNLLLLKDSSIKIGKKQKKSLSFIIKDVNYKKNKKLLSKPKKLYIFIKNDLIEEKFEIILSYYSNGNSAFSENKNSKITGYLSFNTHTKKKMNSNENKLKNTKPGNIKKLNLNTVLKNNNIRPETNIINNRYNLMYEDDKMNENDYLNKAVLDLRNQIAYLKQMLEHSQMKIQKLQLKKENFFFGNLMKEKCVSFFVFGNNYREVYSKKYGDKPREQLCEYQNIVLKNENEKLNRMIHYLKKKLLSYENEFYIQNNNFNNFYRNKNYINNNNYN